MCSPFERTAESVFLWGRFGCDHLGPKFCLPPPTGGSLQVGPHLGTFFKSEGSLGTGARSPRPGGDVCCGKKRVARVTSCSLCSQEPTATHKDVEEGSFEVVVDDLLLQVLPNTCVRLEEEDTNSSTGRARSLGCPSPPGTGRRQGQGGTWWRGCRC